MNENATPIPIPIPMLIVFDFVNYYQKSLIISMKRKPKTKCKNTDSILLLFVSFFYQIINKMLIVLPYPFIYFFFFSFPSLFYNCFYD